METLSSVKGKPLKKRVRSTALAGQRISRRRSKSFLSTFRRPILAAIALSLLTAFGWREYQYLKENLHLRLTLGSEDRLQLDQESLALLEPMKAEILKEKVNSLLVAAKGKSLEGFAADLGVIPNITKIHIFKSQPDTIYMSFEKRYPVFTLNGLQEYPIANDGLPYQGDISDESTSLPSLTGIVTISPQPHSSPHILNETQINLIKDAISLLQQIKDHVAIQEIEYRIYRGFFVKTKDAQEIAIGMPPFPEKIKKLDTLIKNIHEKSLLVKKIELDYEGKAFITESIIPKM